MSDIATRYQAFLFNIVSSTFRVQLFGEKV